MTFPELMPDKHRFSGHQNLILYNLPICEGEIAGDDNAPKNHTSLSEGAGRLTGNRFKFLALELSFKQRCWFDYVAGAVVNVQIVASVTIRFRVVAPFHTIIFAGRHGQVIAPFLLFLGLRA